MLLGALSLGSSTESWNVQHTSTEQSPGTLYVMVVVPWPPVMTHGPSVTLHVYVVVGVSLLTSAVNWLPVLSQFGCAGPTGVISLHTGQGLMATGRLHCAAHPGPVVTAR
jgi:hypothetical protein